ncbi:hypothetical protein [Hyalangium rubrum]|uniref:Uncharacterized protein n=1 Tax=Hyalangium rubrum TaxID=3103134 RepID=A0ABU5H212_9BACT|nr:hypothetical protein [Hyalangium sp. s54d21]MDY7226949.1 hypothetical protein [Hyalangium sp. s54d21]
MGLQEEFNRDMDILLRTGWQKNSSSRKTPSRPQALNDAVFAAYVEAVYFLLGAPSPSARASLTVTACV